MPRQLPGLAGLPVPLAEGKGLSVPLAIGKDFLAARFGLRTFIRRFRPMTLPASTASSRRVRICYFNTWAGGLEEASSYLKRVLQIDLRPLVTNPNDAALLTKARLDCDWYAENLRCFAGMRFPGLEFLSSWTTGAPGLLDVAKAPREPGEERWLLTMGQQSQSLGAIAGRVFALLSQTGVRHFFYAFDEASRFMPCFPEIAPYLDVLIHDENPLAPTGRSRLRSGCCMQHRSWVANVLPFAEPFCATPEEKILFLGSQLGLTAHRRRQIDFLQSRFKDRFTAIHDHSVPIATRGELKRFKVSVCPEGRKFGTPAMSASHTDRPFWSGCLGMVPVSEDSAMGGRLDALHQTGLIIRYAHGDLEALAKACEEALAMPEAGRRRIFEHYNRHETVGTVVAGAIAAAH